MRQASRPSPFSDPLTAARLANSALFFASGFTYAIWGVCLPQIKTQFALDDAGLSLAMFAVALGALLSMSVIGPWIARRGSPTACRQGGLVFALSVAPILLIPHFGLLLAWLLLFGATNAVLDVAINAQAATLELKASRPIMSSFHGLFSTGGLVGALAGSVWLGAGGSAALLFLITALLVAGLVLLGSPHLLPDPHSDAAASRRTAPPGARRRLLGLGVLAFLGLVVEGAMYDWTSVYLRDEVGAPTFWIGAGYGGFSLGMASGRFGGDRLRAWLGARRTLMVSGCLAALGLLLALGLPLTASAVAGFTLVGLGCANCVPVLFAASVKVEGVASSEAIALVGRLGYLGILVGPVIVGFTAHHTSLPLALGLLALFALAIAGGAGKVLPHPIGPRREALPGGK